jgi:hypothetical protein
MIKLAFLASLLSLAACGDNLDSTRPDSRPRADARPQVDSPPGTPDADTTPDAAVSTVTVTNGTCANADHTITTVSNTFRLDGAATPNPALVFDVGDEIEVTLGANHSFDGPTSGEFAWTSGALGNDVCIVFTEQITLVDAVTYQCAMHASMTGTLVVNP